VGSTLLHGYVSEWYVDAADYLVKVPGRLADVAVLLEPASVAEKRITGAQEIQRRLLVWQPPRAAILEAGPLGMVATMALRVRGLEVTTLGLEVPPYLNSPGDRRVHLTCRVSRTSPSVRRCRLTQRPLSNSPPIEAESFWKPLGFSQNRSA
jgi:Glucose dehydrogenase C-terminus